MLRHSLSVKKNIPKKSKGAREKKPAYIQYRSTSDTNGLSRSTLGGNSTRPPKKIPLPNLPLYRFHYPDSFHYPAPPSTIPPPLYRPCPLYLPHYTTPLHYAGPIIFSYEDFLPSLCVCGQYLLERQVQVISVFHA